MNIGCAQLGVSEMRLTCVRADVRTIDADALA